MVPPWKMGEGYERREELIISFLHASRGGRPPEALLAFAGSEVRVLSRKEVKNDDVQLQINPALSYMRLMETNELDFAIKDRNDQWLSVYDDRSCVMVRPFILAPTFHFLR